MNEVICISKSDVPLEQSFTVGKSYLSVNVSPDLIYLKDDDGMSLFVSKNHFTGLRKIRDIKIESILNG